MVHVVLLGQVKYLPILILPFPHLSAFRRATLPAEWREGIEAGLYYRRWERERQGQECEAQSMGLLQNLK
ncbi:MAG: hypothetical protein A2X81_06475 [Desulfobacterales bacterium GWB2_56_26]|nr:MAG: hypothetical protein A2X81_06475 [Desulfobacterales bacterium GWB2_56_26]